MSELMVPAKPPFLRKMALCCLLSPKWECRKCKGAVCKTCNDEDIELQRKGVGFIGYMGHIEAACLEVDNIEVANMLWDMLD